MSNSNRKLCEGMVTFAELHQALKNMQNGKTPETDDFTEFYQFFGVI